jgi:hypothetical protein
MELFFAESFANYFPYGKLSFSATILCYYLEELIQYKVRRLILYVRVYEVDCPVDVDYSSRHAECNPPGCSPRN